MSFNEGVGSEDTDAVVTEVGNSGLAGHDVNSPSVALESRPDVVPGMLRISFRYRRIIRTFVVSTLLLFTVYYAGRQGFLGTTLLSWTREDRGNVLDRRVRYFWGNVSQQQILLSRRTVNRIAEEPDVCQRFTTEPADPKIFMSSVLADLNMYDAGDVTLVTQMSLGKLAVLGWLLGRWDGPVSATLFVQWEELQRLPHLLNDIPELAARTNVDVHLVLSTGEFYPVNFLRNLALRNAQTNYVFLSDVDFIPIPGAHSAIKRHIQRGLLDGKRTLVVPGFEFFQTPDVYPNTKEQLLLQWAEGKLQPFHDDRNGGVSHQSTDSQKWKSAADPYLIVPEGSYEPYLVFRKDLIHPYEERFLGRMFDKVTHTLEAIAKGFEFIVLPDVYTIHMPHPEITYVPYQNCSIDMFYNFKQDMKTNYPDTMANFNFKPEWQIRAKEEQAARKAAQGGAS